MKKFFKKGFTLAEVLITLAIIGVVASIVVPALLKNTNNKETVVRLKKAYYLLTDAYNRLKVNKADLDAAYIDTVSGNGGNVLNIFAPTLAIAQNCGTGTGCWPNGVTYKLLNGSAQYNVDTGTNFGKAILDDGTLIYFHDAAEAGCSHVYGSSPIDKGCGAIYVDINGHVGPNQLGRDYFAFLMTKEGIFPAGVYGDAFAGDCITSSTGYSCTQKVLQENGVNY